MPSLKDIQLPVTDEMNAFQKKFKEAIKSDIRLLNIISNYVIKNKGKQMRPLFVFLTAKMVGEVTDSTYTAASLIELMHTATLIHDDVVDESYERRGVFSIKAIWRSKIAVLFGDFLLARGLLLASNKKDHDLLDIVADTVKQMSEGELLQLQKSLKVNIDSDSYYDIIKKKTATLIASCTAAGAKSAGSDPATVNEIYTIGLNIGMAFQIKDDLFDYQPRGIIGKPTGNDLREKKFTLPLIYAMEHAGAKDARSIMKMIRNGSMNNKKIDYITQFVNEKGGLTYARDKMLEYKNKAENSILGFPDSPSRQALLDLTTFTVERSK